MSGRTRLRPLDTAARPDSPTRPSAPGALAALGRFAARRAPAVLVASSLAVIVFAVLAIGAFGKLRTGGFLDPSASSTVAQRLTDQRFGGASTVVVLVHARKGTVDDAPATSAGNAAAHELAGLPGVGRVTSYWTAHEPGLRSRDHRYALVLGHTRTSRDLSAARLSALRSSGGDVEVSVGGDAAVDHDVTTEVGRSLARGELVAVPIILVLLVLAFGSVVASLVPLVIGLVAILGTFAELFVLGSLTDVAVYSINLTTALGMALGIDYALLMVSRFREELARGRPPEVAIVRTVQTAGRTILFSGATVAAALAVLLMFPLYFLRSFAYAGIGVVIISVTAALLVLPALLAWLGPRVNGGRLPWARRRPPATAAPALGRLAGRAMRRPALFAVPVLVLLGLLALPLRHVQFGTPDDRVLRPSTSSRAVGDVLRDRFAGDSSTALNVVLAGGVERPALAAYATRLSLLPGVVRVDASAGTFVHGSPVPRSADPTLGRPGAQRVAVIGSSDPRSAAAKRLVRTVRRLPGPDGVRVLVGGPTAELIDTTHAIGRLLPLAALLVVLTTFVVLFLFTGSVLQPLRSLVLNAATMAATTGAMVWIFQEGHLSSVLHFTPLPLDTSMLVLLFCLAFGLSMDYEVIVLSRIKELHERGCDDRSAVTEGLTRSGRIVTAAALLMAVSFAGFGSATVSFLQLFGVGSALAVLMDAFLVRTVLVPVCQRVLGRAAWYAPRSLRRLHTRLAVAESA